METEPKKVRCADCGFLCVRRSDLRQFHELSEINRREARLPVVQGKVHSALFWEQDAACFARVPVFEEDLKSKGVPATIHDERTCDCFVQWSQGYTPKEHREMQFAEQIRIREEKREERMMRWENRRDRMMMLTTIFAAVANGIIAGAFVLAVYYMSKK